MLTLRLVPIATLLAALALSACANTVRGVGADVRDTAQAVEEQID